MRDEQMYQDMLDAYRKMSARAMELEKQLFDAKSLAKESFQRGVEAMREAAIRDATRRRYACSSCDTAREVVIDLKTARVENKESP